MDVKHDNDDHHHRNKIIKYSLTDSVDYTHTIGQGQIKNDELNK